MCGIAGIISQAPKKFDFTTFCTLGIHNDTRGGDSVGIFIDGKSEFYCEGATKQSLFENFMEDSKLIQNTEESQIAILHCRKASIGTISIEKAQPVIINDENNKPIFVVMHNGTIYNYKELAKKYIPNIDITGMTDSQVMTHIFFHSGYDVLEEYNGGAVFVILDYREDPVKILFWKGASKQYTSTNTIEEERPLNFVLTSDNELVFSSENTFLSALRPKSKIFTIKDNCLAQFTDDLYVYKQYDRSKCQQREIAKYTPIYSNNYYSNSNSNYGFSNYYSNNNNNNNNNGNSNKNSNGSKSLFKSVIGSMYDGKCRVDSEILHGMYVISDYGYLKSNNEVNTLYHEMYFWNGILLKNKEAYMYLQKFYTSYGEFNTPKQMFEYCEDLILYLSPYPYERIIKNSVSEIREIISPVGGHAFTGELKFPFCTTSQKIVNGIYQSGGTTTIFDSLDLWRLHKDDVLDLEVLSTF